MLNNERIKEYKKVLKMNKELARCTEICLRQCAKGETDQAVYYTVLAPALILYVEWVLNKALEDGTKRLYFLARDGYPMYLVANELCRKGNYSLECRYLYGSRYAWRIPQYHLDIPDAIDKMCLGGIHVTFEMVMRRGGLKDNEAITIAEILGYKQRFKEKLSYQQLQQLKPVLLQCNTLLEYIRKHSKEAYDNTIQYFRQEGLFDKIQYAIVDSGWVGSLQQTLQQLLRSAGKKEEIRGYYFGLYEIPNGMKREQYDAFYFNDRSGINRKVSFSNCLFETIFTAQDGMTLYYKPKDGRYAPCMETIQNANQKALAKNQSYLLKYMAYYEPGKCDSLQSRKIVYQLLKRFMGNPVPEEIDIFGNYEFSDDVLADSMQKVAAQLTIQEIRQHRIVNKILIMAGIKHVKLQDSAWMEGSIVRNGRAIRYSLIHVKIYKGIVYLRKSLYRRKR